MLFNSIEFLAVFLPVVLFVWYRRRLGVQARLIALTSASYLFYGYWDWRFTSLMLVSTVVDYVAGRKIHEASDDSAKRVWLIVSLGTNLALLGFFKYANFFTNTLNEIAAWASEPALLPPLAIVLPVGISFYTFQSMSYSIDIYRGKAEPTSSFWHFAAYVSMFPQLVAGPIVRYSEIEAQLREVEKPVAATDIALGLQFFVLGLSKKLLLADPIATRVDPLWADPASLDALGAWLATMGYTLQIYFDFSGYSDMAVGLGLFLGFRLPQNFDSPYKSVSIADFWRRWHMTLSFWLRDYLYISLGGNRGGRSKRLRNLVITMFLGGLWHGAAWTFVFWGLLHGLYLVVHQLWQSASEWRVPKGAAQVLTLAAVMVSWVFFRAPTFGVAADMFASLVAGLPTDPASYVVLALIEVVALVIALAARNTWEIEFRATILRAVALAALLFGCVLRLGAPSPFLYFQF